MARIEILLSDEEKSNLKLYCQSKGMTASHMLRTLINQSSPDMAFIANFQEVKTNKITVRLTSYNLQVLAKKAKAEGYVSQTNWATACIMSQLHQEPVLSADETQALRESNRQLAAIGRNLNQITKVLNIEFRDSDKITKEMIQLLEDKLTQHKQKVNALLTKNCQRWSINDESFSS
ncbi:plasmid mobilization relaxosome protein MobC [Parashewanella spongiae]|uniref:Plasmid mobilization relaxosome protein MobC n=2 Tax=Parashewanella spongiae TaxID=342950 RepID=A0A3A6U684_9GAMM|nr:plasmid mobilization relaxosome protein MobC [Parashewanella spongiae]MCL1076586.1 plasmid mobilization relaxosome protein MobC [Parashewanella spongiae]RJY19543.1 plasmid mobilization relaxosome protein MobC [Parashewanella spongiae]